MSVCLVMIVKNESAVIRRCLDSVLDHIDCYVIFDTGSTDDTKKIIKRCMKGIPGVLKSRPWVNFGHNRTEALQEARGKADWLLTLDADCTIEGTIPQDFQQDAGMTIVRNGNIECRLPVLLRGGKPWKSIGALHEYIDCEDIGSFKYGTVNSFYVIAHQDGGSKRSVEDDLAHFQNEFKKNPDDPRTVFYLAEMYKFVKRFDEAEGLYNKRKKMDGFEEEGWYSEFWAANLLIRRDFDAGVVALLRAYERRPIRAEPLYELAWHYNNHGMYHTAVHFGRAAAVMKEPPDFMFVYREVYRWAAKYELTKALGEIATSAEQLKGCAELDRLLLLEPTLPVDARKEIKVHQKWARTELKKFS